MKLKLIPLLLGLGLTTSLSAATERMCFGQVPIEATTDLVAKITIAENEYFTTNKCKRYFSYYEKHVDFPKEDCAINSDQLSLDKGYAPFPVFLRGTDSTSSKNNIASYDWEIKNTTTNEVLTTYNAFNASYIFDEPGEYNATLTITDKDGTQSTDTKNITVWARDGKDYFVDSEIGDDRFNGLAQIPNDNCDANTAPLNSCSGPWKTATRALGEMAPYQVINYPNGEYTVDNICATTETVDIVRYKQGNFKIFRSSTFVESAALKDKNGQYLPVVPTQLCSTKVATRRTTLRPGDQVLFNRSQQFKLETAINSIRKYTTVGDGVTYNYEKLVTASTVTVGHWSQAKGVHFGAYGSGNTPLIKNTGKTSNTAIQLQGFGMFGFTMTNLEFNLKSSTATSFNPRATFVAMYGNPINTAFKHISIKEMNQGILASVKEHEPQGLFIFNSNFYDSKVTQLFTSTSFQDVAIINNSYDYSYNHLIYSNISHGLVYNNTLSRPAFGRTAFRINGGDFENPNNYVWISDNTMTGWIDPRTNAEFGKAFADGTRYNYALVNISPNNKLLRPISFHDIVFTRNQLSDAESFMTVGAGENIKIHHNTFQSPNPTATPYIRLSPLAHRPLRNNSINNNKFIDSASIQDAGWAVTAFIQWSNYSHEKCTDQFNHKKINISNNSFYTLNNQRRLLTFADIKQGRDLDGVELPDLTLDQAEAFLSKELTMHNNQFISTNENTPTIQIGGNAHSSGNVKVNNDTIDWSQFFQSSDSKYRLYNTLSQFTQQMAGELSWTSTDSMSIDTLLASNTVAGAITEPLTWDDLIVYAEKNSITPDQLEVMILNQVLASNPTYSMPGTDYSSDLPVFDAIGQWFASIPSSMASLFSPKENKWNDAKQLATINKVSNSTIMVNMTK